MELNERRAEHHRRSVRITGFLLAVWFVATFVVGYFARELSFDFFGWPFSFWMGAQGGVVIYLLIIWYYAHAMNRLDREFGVGDDD